MFAKAYQVFVRGAAADLTRLPPVSSKCRRMASQHQSHNTKNLRQDSSRRRFAVNQKRGFEGSWKISRWLKHAYVNSRAQAQGAADDGPDLGRRSRTCNNALCTIVADRVLFKLERRLNGLTHGRRVADLVSAHLYRPIVCCNLHAGTTLAGGTVGNNRSGLAASHSLSRRGKSLSAHLGTSDSVFRTEAMLAASSSLLTGLPASMQSSGTSGPMWWRARRCHISTFLAVSMQRCAPDAERPAR